MNGVLYFCTAGIGLDAEISLAFENSEKRGFLTYAKLSLKSFLRFRAIDVMVITESEHIQEKALLVCVANAKQYGNNAWIAPQAKLNDGLLDVCILRPFPIWKAPEVGIRLMQGTLRNSLYFKTCQVERVQLQRVEQGAVHFDGDPAIMGKEIHFEVMPNAVEVIIP